MALANEVTGDGKLIASSNEQGSYSQTYTRASDDTQRIRTTLFTDVRSERKWYALTESAVTTYITNNPTKTLAATCTNEVTNAWELTETSQVRTITAVIDQAAPEEA